MLAAQALAEVLANVAEAEVRPPPSLVEEPIAEPDDEAAYDLVRLGVPKSPASPPPAWTPAARPEVYILPVRTTNMPATAARRRCSTSASSWRRSAARLWLCLYLAISRCDVSVCEEELL